MTINIVINIENYTDFCNGKIVQVYGGTATDTSAYLNITANVDELELITEIDNIPLESNNPQLIYTHYVKRIVPDITNKRYDDVISIGDTVIIKDAMDTSYIGKEGIVEAISSSSPISYKLNIDGKPGSWGCAWLRSCVTKKVEKPKPLITYDMVLDSIKRICRVSLNGKWFHCSTATMLPLYEARFDGISPFDEFGISCAKLDGKEFHIGMDGEAIYEERFDIIWGFNNDGIAKAFLNSEGGEAFKINKQGKRV